MIGINTGFQGQLSSALVNAAVMTFQGMYVCMYATAVRECCSESGGSCRCLCLCLCLWLRLWLWL